MSERFFFLVLTHPVRPGLRAVKRADVVLLNQVPV